MDDATRELPICRLCGIGIRGRDDAARLGDDYFHAACAEPAFRGTAAWGHLKIGDLNNLATGAGRAAIH